MSLCPKLLAEFLIRGLRFPRWSAYKPNECLQIQHMLVDRQK